MGLSFRIMTLISQRDWCLSTTSLGFKGMQVRRIRLISLRIYQIRFSDKKNSSSTTKT